MTKLLALLWHVTIKNLLASFCVVCSFLWVNTGQIYKKYNHFTKIYGCNDFYLNIFPILLTVNWWTMKGLGIYSSVLFLNSDAFSVSIMVICLQEQ